jgi:hypothetical protein
VVERERRARTRAKPCGAWPLIGAETEAGGTINRVQDFTASIIKRVGVLDIRLAGITTSAD